MESTYFPQVGDIIDVVTTDFYPAKKTNLRGIRDWDDRELAKLSL
jgi:2-oxoisovalerate dehydrogenase E1 component